MYKQHLLNAIVNEMKICRRLYTKIPEDKMNFRPKDNIRSIHELLQYLCVIGTVLPDYWLNHGESDFYPWFDKKVALTRQIPHEQFLFVMNDQIQLICDLFDRINEEDLLNKKMTYPWGGSAPFGEAIISTSVKFLTGYKLQLFLCIKMCTDQKLGTPDAWLLTELD
jgi:hypothetical protein